MEHTTPTKRKNLIAAVTLPPELHQSVTEIARDREWSFAQTGRYLIKLGLEKLEEVTKPATQEPAAN
jgi:hypothetical protein